MNTVKIYCFALIIFACNTPIQNSQPDIKNNFETDTEKTLEDFYGYTPEEILGFSIEEDKALVQKYNIKPVNYMKLKLRAEQEIYKKQIIRDSIATQKIYSRIERKLKED